MADTPNPKPKPSKEQVERELKAREANIEGRLSALQEEVRTIVPAVGRSIATHPLVLVGGALAAGLAVGLIFGGRKKSRPEEHHVLMEAYVESLVADARRRVRRGQETGEAVRRALKDRVPVIVMEAEGPPPRQNVVRRAVDIALRSALGFGITSAFNFLTGYLQGGIGPTATESAAESAVATAAVSESLNG